MNVTAVAAMVYLVLTVGVIAFQLALAAGVPWGSYAMGGAFPGKFPPRLRVAAVVQAAILGLLAAVVLSHAGLLHGNRSLSPAWMIWCVVAFAAVGVVLNSISPSPGERRIWVPVTILLLASSVAVALGT